MKLKILRRPTDMDAMRAAYRGKAKIERKIREKEAEIQKLRNTAKEYIEQGYAIEAKKLAKSIVKLEEDKSRLYTKKITYDRVIAAAESGVDDAGTYDVDRLLATWARSRNKTKYGEEFGDLLAALEEREAVLEDMGREFDQLQEGRGAYDERAETIYNELVTEVNLKKRAVKELEMEAEEENEQLQI